MGNNDIKDMIPEENQGKQAKSEQEQSSVGKKIAHATGETIKGVAEVTGSVAKEGVEAVGKGVFGMLGNLLASYGHYMAIVAAVAAVAGGVVAGVKALIDANKIEIMDTVTVVTEIRKISELTTYTYIDELLIHETKSEAKEAKAGFFGLGKKQAVPDTLRSEIVIIVSGTTRAGYDLGKIAEDDIKIAGDTVSVQLPTPEIFDIIVNPSDNKMFVEEGKWSHEEVTRMQVDCRDRMLQNAIDRGILKKADEVGQKKVENLFKSLGFNVVKVNPNTPK